MSLGGSKIKKDSEDRIKAKGDLKDGDVYLGVPGNLRCKALAHAVGPHWNGGNNNEEALLKQAVEKCLRKTDKANFTSIAIPALCAGIYNYPVDLSCKHIIEEVELYLKVDLCLRFNWSIHYLCFKQFFSAVLLLSNT